MRRRAVVLLIGVVLISDAVIIALAAANRAGEPECVLTLTERELALPPFREEESTGLALSFAIGKLPWFTVRRIADRRGVSRQGLEHEWLDDAKLAALGFRTAWDPADTVAMERYSRWARPAFIVLEMDGPAYARVSAARDRELEEARAALAEGKTDRERVTGLATLRALDAPMCSRLVPVDAGRGAGALRSRYPDRTRYCVAPGLVRLRLDQPSGKPPRLRGAVELVVSEVDVPHRLRPLLAPYLARETGAQVAERERGQPPPLPWPTPTPARYTVKIAFGRHLEPWIVDIVPTGEIPATSR